MENHIICLLERRFIMSQYVSYTVYIYLYIYIYMYIQGKQLKFSVIPVVPRLQHLFAQAVGWNLFTKDTSMFSVRITNSLIARIFIYQKLRDIETSISTNKGKQIINMHYGRFLWRTFRVPTRPDVVVVCIEIIAIGSISGIC